MSQDDDKLRGILIFVDRNGTVLGKSSSGMSSSLKMEYSEGDLHIVMNVFAHGMGNGACSAKVTHKGHVVYDAAGCYTSGPFNTKVKSYHHGSWEKLIPDPPARRR